jgi:hypothetical protein
MVLKFYRKGRHEVTLRFTSDDDYHLSWHYRAADGIATKMESLLMSLLAGDEFSMTRLRALLKYYDEVRIS